jgi:hypothetical protein
MYKVTALKACKQAEEHVRACSLCRRLRQPYCATALSECLHWQANAGRRCSLSAYVIDGVAAAAALRGQGSRDQQAADVSGVMSCKGATQRHVTVYTVHDDMSPLEGPFTYYISETYGQKISTLLPEVVQVVTLRLKEWSKSISEQHGRTAYPIKAQHRTASLAPMTVRTRQQPCTMRYQHAC